MDFNQKAGQTLQMALYFREAYYLNCNFFAFDHRAALPSGKEQSMQVKSVSTSAGKIGKSARCV
ncbi:hypothetical protein ACFS07_13060 [Undibacterium arcticum]